MGHDAVAVRCAEVQEFSSRAGAWPPRLERAVAAGWAKEASAVSVSYPGTPASVPAARQLVRKTLAGSPRRDDLELIVAELATNAIKHTRSGMKGGTFTITILPRPDGVRLEILDLGSRPVPATPVTDELDEYGRGLLIVTELADKAGHDVITGRTHSAWAEVNWLAHRLRRHL
jgi:serine/threonine-protein kinase RsbW